VHLSVYIWIQYVPQRLDLEGRTNILATAWPLMSHDELITFSSVYLRYEGLIIFIWADGFGGFYYCVDQFSE
jgi:hypothetical protein